MPLALTNILRKNCNHKKADGYTHQFILRGIFPRDNLCPLSGRMIQIPVRTIFVSSRKSVKGVLTQNVAAELAYVIDFREHAYIMCKISTANIAWHVF